MRIFTKFFLIILTGCNFEYPVEPYHLVDYYPITRTTAKGKILQVDPRDFGGLGEAGQTCMEALKSRADRSTPALAPVFPNPASLDDIEIKIPFETTGGPSQLMIFDHSGKLVKTLFSSENKHFGLTSWKIQSSIYINDRVEKGYYEVVLNAGNKLIRGNIYVF
jgi:hypothetical protein